MMNRHGTAAPAPPTGDASTSYPALALLPAGLRVPPRGYQVCDELRRWELPDDLAQLGLFARLLERGSLQPEQLAAVLGPEAASIAQALVQASSMPCRSALLPVERPWRLFLLAYLHPTAAVIKLAELLAQTRQPTSESAIDRPVLQAAAALATRLGMWGPRSELLNRDATLADPRLAEQAERLLAESNPARQEFFEGLRHDLNQRLAEVGISARIERRARKIHQLMHDGLSVAKSSFPFPDYVAIAIDDVADCYRALGVINSSYPVISARVRDYIGGPKDNGYRAINTSVEYTTIHPVERTVQLDLRIFTPAMDRFNQRGYLEYLRGEADLPRRKLWWRDRQRFLDSLAENADDMAVFTPRGEVIFLPPGATVLDFAVRVHRDLGVFCRGALLNQRRVSPGQPLEWGDMCEVLPGTTGDSLDARLLDQAATSSAKSAIRRSLQRDNQGADRGERIFREVLARSLEAQEVQASESLIEQQLAAFCRHQGYQTPEAFYRAVARGEAAPDKLVQVVVEELLRDRVDASGLPAEVRQQARRVRLALCCRPSPSQAAVAVPIHSGHELKIHRASCSHIKGESYPVIWRPADQQAHVADVVYESWDRPGLIYLITSAMQEIGGINIRRFQADVPEQSLARVRFSFETSEQPKIEQVRQKLNALPERRFVDVRPVGLVDEGVRMLQPLSNPYSPQPATRKPMFVGRESELERMLNHLDGRSGPCHILIHGPKRVGKSSLLHHLSHYYLEKFRVPSLLDLQSLPNDELTFPKLLERFARLMLKRCNPHEQVAPPAPDELHNDPLGSFRGFLGRLHQATGGERFVLLIDELGTVLSRSTHEQNLEFFDMWRALLNNEEIYRHVVFIVALPDSMLARPVLGGDQSIGRIGELGHPIRLSLLEPEAASELITAPVASHLRYQPHDLALLLRETGGHPYYIHRVCSHIVTAIQLQQRRSAMQPSGPQLVPSSLVQEALAKVADHDDAFFHVRHDSSEPTLQVLLALAACTSAAQPRIGLTWLYQQGLPVRQIAEAARERPDLLDAQVETLAFRVALVARWLRRQQGKKETAP